MKKAKKQTKTLVTPNPGGQFYLGMEKGYTSAKRVVDLVLIERPIKPHFIDRVAFFFLGEEVIYKRIHNTINAIIDDKINSLNSGDMP